ncbi:cation transporter [Mangrovactinospora gilvigrisea]|uniref:Cation transporter n=1 Tax=Mangrovactinospora gilvigrisea TaxID=1428644 RepID=A0A1J7BQU3_9ACTN|nr:cation diffusion facilitator family transporter [Mangrovactinospora gilvigrisea]OIV35817.1 cation transporter [Mangrovactinospora gilvigrisea]
MGAGHDHGHDHGAGLRTAAAAHRGRLRTVLAITCAIMLVEVVGGLATGSLGLLADAGHMAADALGVATALLAVHLANKPATARRTFGLARAEVLAAVGNALLLFVLAGVILWQAVARFAAPPEVGAGPAAAFALLAVAGNSVSLMLLRRGQAESLNVRGAFLEVLSDALGAAAVVVSSAVIWATGWYRADAVASVLIAVMILPRTWKLLRRGLDVLLESVPEGVDITEVRRHLLEHPRVADVHDLHAWTLTSGLPVLSAHVVVDDDEELGRAEHDRLLDELQRCLGGHFDLDHSTLQLEPAGHADHEASRCG